MNKAISLILILFSISFLGVYLSSQVEADQNHTQMTVLVTENEQQGESKIFKNYKFSFEQLIVITVSVLIGAVLGGVIVYAVIRKNIRSVSKKVIEEMKLEEEMEKFEQEELTKQ